MNAELILVNGRITTLNKGSTEVSSAAVNVGRFQAVGSEAEVVALNETEHELSTSEAAQLFQG